MLKALKLTALTLLMSACVADTVAPSDPRTITLSTAEIYGFVTMDSPETVVGFNVMCPYSGGETYQLTLGQNPCPDPSRSMLYGTNDFIKEDAYQIRLADGTHVRIYRMLKQTASGPEAAFPGTYIQRYHGAGTIKNGVISDPAAVYDLQIGNVQYLGHVSGEQPTVWQENEALAAKLVEAIPSLTPDRVRMDAALTYWNCDFVASVFTSGGTWKCQRR